MNLEDTLKNINPQALSSALAQLSGVLPPEQLRQAEQAIHSARGGNPDPKLSSLSPADLKRALQENPDLAKELGRNPEVRRKIGEIFKP